MGKFTRYLPPRTPRIKASRSKTSRNKNTLKTSRCNLFSSLFLKSLFLKSLFFKRLFFKSLFLVLNLLLIAGLFALMNLRSPALSETNLDIEIQNSSSFFPEASKDVVSKQLIDKKLDCQCSGFYLNKIHFTFPYRRDVPWYVSTKCNKLNRKPLYITRKQSLPALKAHPLASTLRKWQDVSNSGDYFSEINPTPVGYLVWSQFPVKIYITTLNKLPQKQAQTWVETVSQVVSEWQNYLPLEIVDQADSADITIERKAPPLQFDRNRKLSRARSAQATYKLYTKNNTLYHRFTILLSPSQTGKYLLAATRHELGHALGIWGHSSMESDALYFSQVRNPPPISPRDINTLKSVYEQPTSLGWSLP